MHPVGCILSVSPSRFLLRGCGVWFPSSRLHFLFRLWFGFAVSVSGFTCGSPSGVTCGAAFGVTFGSAFRFHGLWFDLRFGFVVFRFAVSLSRFALGFVLAVRFVRGVAAGWWRGLSRTSYGLPSNG